MTKESHDLLTQPKMYRYRLTSTNYSSARYGPCEICGEDASEVFIQVEERKYRSKAMKIESWTHDKCNTYFGHRDCLISKQQQARMTEESHDPPAQPKVFGFSHIAQAAFAGEFPRLNQYLVSAHNEMAAAVGFKDMQAWPNLSAEDFRVYLEEMPDEEFEQMAADGLWDELGV
jgi:hypothetical protein